MFALALSAAATTKGCRVGPRPGPRAPVLPVRFCFNGFTSWQADIPNANGEWCPVKLMRQTQSSAKNCHAHCHARFRKGEEATLKVCHHCACATCPACAGERAKALALSARRQRISDVTTKHSQKKGMMQKMGSMMASGLGCSHTDPSCPSF